MGGSMGSSGDVERRNALVQDIKVLLVPMEHKGYPHTGVSVVLKVQDVDGWLFDIQTESMDALKLLADAVGLKAASSKVDVSGFCGAYVQLAFREKDHTQPLGIGGIMSKLVNFLRIDERFGLVADNFTP